MFLCGFHIFQEDMLITVMNSTTDASFKSVQADLMLNESKLV